MSPDSGPDRSRDTSVPTSILRVPGPSRRVPGVFSLVRSSPESRTLPSEPDNLGTLDPKVECSETSRGPRGTLSRPPSLMGFWKPEGLPLGPRVVSPISREMWFLRACPGHGNLTGPVLEPYVLGDKGTFRTVLSPGLALLLPPRAPE